VQCKRAKYAAIRYGLFLRLWFRVTLIFISLVLPCGVIYINADPTIQLVKLSFQALPFIPFALNSVSPFLLPFILTPTRYILIVIYGFEVSRMICFSVAIMLILATQFQDAFDFQLDFFQKSVNNPLSQISLKHVIKYREIIIVRDTFNSSISFGPVIFIVLLVPLIL
jgi:hypothetical protein